MTAVTIRLRTFLFGWRVIAVTGSFMALLSCSSAGRDWQSARNRSAIDGYEAFLRKHPTDGHARQARQKIEELEWQQAVKADQPEGYRRFLREHPANEHAVKAHDRIEELNFEVARATDTSESYSAFIKSHPNGLRHDLAQARLEEISFEAARKLNSAAALERHLKAFPMGKHSIEARSLAEERRVYRGTITNVLVGTDQGPWVEGSVAYLDTRNGTYELLGPKVPGLSFIGQVWEITGTRVRDGTRFQDYDMANSMPVGFVNVLRNRPVNGSLLVKRATPVGGHLKSQIDFGACDAVMDLRGDFVPPACLREARERGKETRLPQH